MDNNNYHKDRVNVLLLTGSLCGVTVVLALTPALTSSSNLQSHTIHSLLYGWEAVLYYISIISLVLLTCLKDNRTYFEYEAQPQSINIDPVVRNTPWWTHIPMRQSFLTFLFLGSLVFPGFESNRAIENLSCFVDETGWLLAFLVLTVCKNTGCIIFCLTQMSFLLKVSHNIIKHRFLKYMHSLTLAANFSLCVDVILNIFYTSGTMELYNKIQNSSTKHISEDTLSEQAVYLKCENNTAKPDNAILYFFKYSYQFRTEYALLSLCFLIPIWNIFERQIGEPDGLNNSPPASSNNSRRASITSISSARLPSSIRDEHRKQVLMNIKLWIKSTIKLTFIFVTKHALILSVLIVCGIFSAHLYTDTYNNFIEPEAQVIRYYFDNNTMATEWNSTIQTVYTYTICIVAFIGWILVRSEEVERKQFAVIDTILLVGTFGHLLLILFETIDSTELFVGGKHEKDATTKVFFFVKTILHYVGLYSQVILVLKATKIKVCQDTSGKTKQTLIKGIIVFIGVCNVEKWVVDNFLTPVALNYAEAIDFQEVYGQVIWWNIVELLYPFVAVYRLISAIMCFEACMRFKQAGLC